MCNGFRHMCDSFHHMCNSFRHTCDSFHHMCNGFCHLCAFRRFFSVSSSQKTKKVGRISFPVGCLFCLTG
jgi:hypothetical protein